MRIERERLLSQFILVHSTLSYIQFPEQPLGSTSNQTHITIHTITREVILIPQEPLTLFATHTPLVGTPSDFTSFDKLHKFVKEEIQESRKEHTTPEFTGTTELLRSHLEPMHTI